MIMWELIIAEDYTKTIRRMIFIDPLNLTSHFSQCDFSYQGSLEEFAYDSYYLRISDLDIVYPSKK